MRMNLQAGNAVCVGTLLGVLIAMPIHFAAAAESTGASRDPRDFSGLWRGDGGGPPGGAAASGAGPSGAAPPSGGPPGGGGPGGGPPGGGPPGGGATLPYNADAQRIAERRLQLSRQNKPEANAHLTCRPTSLDALNPQAAALLVQTPEKLIFISQEDRSVKQIFLKREHPKHPVPSYMGDSIGHWEGNTLVVDTVGYNGRVTLGMPPAAAGPSSTRLHTVERWTKSADGNKLNIVVKIEDPVYYTEPFTQTYALVRLEGVRLLDYDCAENPREDDFAVWTFEDDWFKPTCIFPVKNGLASDKIACTPQRSRRK